MSTVQEKIRLICEQFKRTKEATHMPVDQGNGGQLVYTASRLKTTAAIDANCGLKKATAMCTASGTKMTMNTTTGAQNDQENPGHEEEDQLRELSELIEQVKQFDEKN